MNKSLSSMIAALLMTPLAAVAAETASDADAQAPGLPATAELAAAASGEPAKASTDAPAPETVGDEVEAATEGSEVAAPDPAAQSGTEKSPADDKPAEPITGAFGIPLGEPFVPSMVADVLGEQEHSYRGKDDAQLKGTLYRVKPNQPDQRFQDYSVKTTDKGIIYAINGDDRIEPKQGNKQDKAKQGPGIRKQCKDAVKALAGELEAKYGKARSADGFGNWFSFRQLSDTDNRSIRLYGQRCRTGRYSVVYTDEKLLHGLPAKAVRSSEPVKIMIGGPEKRVTETTPAEPTPGTVSKPQTDVQSSTEP